MLVRALIIATILANFCNGFYIPGWSKTLYKISDKVPLLVNKITSDATQLPYAYKDLPFVCELKGSKKGIPLNLGQTLRGDRTWQSDYILEFGIEKESQVLCTKQVKNEGLRKADELIRANYVVEWFVDNLPGATTFVSTDRTQIHYAAGFPLGFVSEDNQAYLNNHVTLIIRYRNSTVNANEYSIVGFEVYPKSLASSSAGTATETPFIIDPELETSVIPFSYTVYWKENRNVNWANRWSLYFTETSASLKIHWFSIINSLCLTAFLTLVTAVVIIKTLNRDIESYNKNIEGEIEGDKNLNLETTGWKLVHADVFRPPVHTSSLASLIGSGVQVFLVVSTLIGLSCVGILNPSYRGGLETYAIALFSLAGIVSGYVSARVYKNLNGNTWLKNAMYTAILVPSIIFGLVLILNMFVWSQSSSNALPFGTITALAALWCLIATPLVIIGAYFGEKKGNTLLKKFKVSANPRPIPRQPRFLRLFSMILVCGMIPFAVIFIELRFILKNIWHDKSGYYYIYGFLALVFIMSLTTVFETAIVSTYMQLNHENYHWWWRSLLIGSGSAVWVFMYSVFYVYFKLDIDGFVSYVLFFGYSLIGSILYGLITASAGFIASYCFVRQIYGNIKVD
ncbi:endomembrane protein 70 [Nadsonia fulvescens var. elongata DSM 6958]|uniref:Transmembrane 9 superfamily member n=1 Tax=Nadsonia fulvescens var. elongata DSM 6958 TaxID=857566 RepID=A0A1E3PLU1_9ASCO|nr:endomembrane protein 70 [Nadsonia fulvescens var. elongata DSM 6958]